MPLPEQIHHLIQDGWTIEIKPSPHPDGSCPVEVTVRRHEVAYDKGKDVTIRNDGAYHASRLTLNEAIWDLLRIASPPEAIHAQD